MASFKKNILIITDNEYPTDIRIQHQIKSLNKNCFDVIVFSLRYSKDVPEMEIRDNLIIYRYYIKKTLANKLKSTVLRLPFYTDLLYLKIQKLVSKFNINLYAIQVCDLPLTNLGLKLKEANRAKLIIDFREPYPCYLLQARHTKKMFGGYLYAPSLWNKYEQYALNNADKIICVIDEAKDRYNKKYHQKISVIPNVVDLDDFQSIEHVIYEKLIGFNIVHFGEVTRLRGCDDVIAAIQHLKNIIPNITYNIVGNGDYVETLNQRVKLLRLEDHVKFWGWVDYRIGCNIISQCDAGIISSTKCDHTDNTIPNKLFHYMMLQKPIIASNCIPVNRILKECNCGVTYSNIKELINSIINVYYNKSLSCTMGKNGQTSIENIYNWNAIGKHYSENFLY